MGVGQVIHSLLRGVTTPVMLNQSLLGPLYLTSFGLTSPHGTSVFLFNITSMGPLYFCPLCFFSNYLLFFCYRLSLYNFILAIFSCASVGDYTRARLPRLLQIYTLKKIEFFRKAIQSKLTPSSHIRNFDNLVVVSVMLQH